MAILAEGKAGAMVPYRDSKLTRLLQVRGTGRRRAVMQVWGVLLECARLQHVRGGGVLEWMGEELRCHDLMRHLLPYPPHPLNDACISSI